MWEFKKPKKQDKTSLWAMLGIGAASLVAAVLLSEKLAPKPAPPKSPFGGKGPLNLKKLMLIGASVVAIMLLVDLTDLSHYYKTSLFEPEEQEKIEDVAKDQLGKPYKLGATGPDAFDCSGFTQYVMKQVGIDLPRTSRDQGTVGKEIDLDDAGVGDLVFFYTNPSAPDVISHVGILLNQKGEFINANSWLQKINVDDLNVEYWRTRLASIREIQIPGRTGEKQKVTLKPADELDQTEPSWGETLPPSEKSDTRLDDGNDDSKVAAETEEVTAELSEQNLSQVTEETDTSEGELATVEETKPSIPDFPDVSADHPRYTEIKYLQTEGIVKGYSDSTFRPESTVTRAELLKIVMNAKGIAANGTTDLSDIKDHWVEPYVATARKLKIVNGYPDGTFHPNAPVSMVEAFKIILNTMHVTVSKEASSLPYQNIDLKAWYAPYIAKVYESNLLDLPGNELNPDTKILRQDVATLIYRIEMLDSSGVPEQA